jgi:hypothetical protein
MEMDLDLGKGLRVVSKRITTRGEVSIPSIP